MGYTTESLAVADEILQIDPTHEQAMDSRVVLLWQLGRRTDALEAVNTLIDAYPQDYDARALKVQLMRSLGADADEIVSEVGAWLAGG